jgi:putative FmdB family regulatory protein
LLFVIKSAKIRLKAWVYAMPMYEYKCASCGDVFEVIQKFSDEPLHEHPGCGGALERLISVSALQFKGSGWYVNDYGRNGSGTEKPKSEPKPTPAKETSSTSKAETKAEK